MIEERRVAQHIPGPHARGGQSDTSAYQLATGTSNPEDGSIRRPGMVCATNELACHGTRTAGAAARSERQRPQRSQLGLYVSQMIRALLVGIHPASYSESQLLQYPPAL